MNSKLVKLALVAGVCLMFSQTISSVLTLAQSIDRVTAEKVYTLSSYR